MDFRQWEVGNDVSKKGYDLANYKYDANPGAHGRYYEYDTPNGKVVTVEHTSDGVPHYHAGRAKPSADPFTYDFKKIDIKTLLFLIKMNIFTMVIKERDNYE